MTRRLKLAWPGRRVGVRPGNHQATGHGPGRDDIPSPAGTAPTLIEIAAYIAVLLIAALITIAAVLP